ncbi:hypothetical protein RIF29_23843 [Crotalaria pallida]|uniref:Uncharacterized protein n=1 Tax=Crotalaria pallida TaxID=3830 RepID=A0AAN9EIP2_CROPI
MAVGQPSDGYLRASSSTASLLIRIGTYGASIGVRRAGNRPVTSIPSARYGWSGSHPCSQPVAKPLIGLASPVRDSLVRGFLQSLTTFAISNLTVATVPWVGDWKRNHRVAAWG